MSSKARPVGFEPTTLGSEDRCAIQLRHGRSTMQPSALAGSCSYVSTALRIESTQPFRNGLTETVFYPSNKAIFRQCNGLIEQHQGVRLTCPSLCEF